MTQETCRYCSRAIERYKGAWWSGNDFQCPDGQHNHEPAQDLLLERQTDPCAMVRTRLGEYYVGDLRDLASEWHGGQWSALYAFASSGTVVASLASEAEECATLCERKPEAEWSFDEPDKLRAIASLEINDTLENNS